MFVLTSDCQEKACVAWEGSFAPCSLQEASVTEGTADWGSSVRLSLAFWETFLERKKKLTVLYCVLLKVKFKVSLKINKSI